MMGRARKTEIAPQESATASPWLTEEEAAAYLRYSPRSLQSWRRIGKIMTKRGVEMPPQHYQHGGKILYRQTELDTWVRDGRSE